MNVQSTGSAATFGGQVFQSFTGVIEITSGIGGTGSNFLTATFTDTSNAGVLSGTTGGSQAQLTATGPPNTLTLTSDFATFANPTSMTMGFSNVNPGLGISGTSIAPFTAQNTGTFGANVVPEPASFVLAGIGLGFVSLAVGRSRRKVAKV